MPKYPDNKPSSRALNQTDVEAMIGRAKRERDKFLLAILYLTGARISEVCRRMKASDFDMPLMDDFITIKVFIAKQGRIKNFHITHRELEVSKQAPFVPLIMAYVQGHQPEDALVPISTRRAQTIIDECSDKTVCPNIFRHNRLTRLAHDGATLDELKNWKGAADIRSISPYLQARKVGRRMVIT